jgi:RHS repeat-associated protein
LGTQSGEAGGAAGGATPAWSTWYYHFNDLGTVLATTDSGGDAIGVYEPDFFGNYTQTVVAEGDGGEGGEGGGEGGFQALTVPETPAPRPDTLGLQSKFFDPWAGLYDFGLRWLDPERGRWMSEEPLGLDGPNLYQFVFNAPLGYWDFMGLNGSQLTGDPYIDWFYERNEKFSKGHAYVFPEVMRQAWDSSDEVFEELSRLPVVGAIGDAANAFVYTCKGEYTKAGISFFWFAMPGNGKLWDDVLERHHLLPKEFKNWFKDRGLNVEDFVMVIGRSMHRYKPNGLHTGLNGDNWNAVWRAFKENNPTATRQEIIDQMLRMLDDFWKRFD